MSAIPRGEDNTVFKRSVNGPGHSTPPDIALKKKKRIITHSVTAWTQDGLGLGRRRGRPVVEPVLGLVVEAALRRRARRALEQHDDVVLLLPLAVGLAAAFALLLLLALPLQSVVDVVGVEPLPGPVPDLQLAVDFEVEVGDAVEQNLRSRPLEDAALEVGRVGDENQMRFRQRRLLLLDRHLVDRRLGGVVLERGDVDLQKRQVGEARLGTVVLVRARRRSRSFGEVHGCSCCLLVCLLCSSWSVWLLQCGWQQQFWQLFWQLLEYWSMRRRTMRRRRRRQ